MAPAQNVHVQMRDGFTGVGAIVDDEAIAGVRDAKRFGDFASLEQQMAEHFVVFGLGVGDARNGLAWANQDVSRRASLDVAKGKNEIVFIDDLGRDFASGDFLEESLTHTGQS